MSFLEDAVAAAAQGYGIDAALIEAQMRHESKSDPLAIGDGGRALGLLQVHLEACQDLGRGDDWHKLHGYVLGEDIQNAMQLGLDLGVAYLARMLAQFKGDAAWALAAYNQGPTVIRRAKEYSDAVLALVKA